MMYLHMKYPVAGFPNAAKWSFVSRIACLTPCFTGCGPASIHGWGLGRQSACQQANDAGPAPAGRCCIGASAPRPGRTTNLSMRTHMRHASAADSSRKPCQALHVKHEAMVLPEAPRPIRTWAQGLGSGLAFNGVMGVVRTGVIWFATSSFSSGLFRELTCTFFWAVPSLVLILLIIPSHPSVQWTGKGLNAMFICHR